MTGGKVKDHCFVHRLGLGLDGEHGVVDQGKCQYRLRPKRRRENAEWRG